MSKDKKKFTEPTQLPEMVWHEPTKQWGFFEIRVPIAWKDFIGVDRVKVLTAATLNIVDAIKEEWEQRLTDQKVVKAEVRETAKAKVAAQREVDKKASIQLIIDKEPDLVKAKRNELGVDIISDETAATIIYQERQAPPEKPKDLPKSASKKTTPSKPVDTDGYDPPPLPEGDFGETVRFYKSEYGWSAYLDGSVWEDMIPVLFDWLVSIPKEMRHRTGTKYPCISESGKFLMVNDYEKTFITTAAEGKGLEITIKED